MARGRFAGWAAYPEVFEQLGNDDPMRHVHPAQRMSSAFDGSLWLHLHKDHPDRTAWFADCLARVKPRCTTSARIVMARGVPAFIALTIHAGDVDPDGFVEGTPTLIVPIALIHRTARNLVPWCGRASRVAVVSTDGAQTVWVAAVLKARPNDIKRAIVHSRRVARGRVGHRQATGALVPLGSPDISPPTAAELAAAYSDGPAEAIRRARAARHRLDAAEVLDAFARVASPADLVALALGEDSDLDDARTLARHLTDHGLLLDVLEAHQAGSPKRRRRNDHPVHPGLLAAVLDEVGVGTLARSWADLGRDTPRLRRTIVALRDRTVIHRYVAAVHPDPEARADVLLDLLGVHRVAKDVADTIADPSLVAILGRPDGPLGVGDALTVAVTGLQVDLDEAARLLLDWGWPLRAVGESIGRGGRWTALWEWLTSLVEGDALIEAALDCGMPTDRLLAAVDRRPRRSVGLLVDDLGVSQAVVDDLVAQAGVDLSEPAPRPAVSQLPAPVGSDDEAVGSDDEAVGAADDVTGDAGPDDPLPVEQLPVEALPVDPVSSGRTDNGQAPATVAEAVVAAEDSCAHLVFLPEAHASASASSYPDAGRVLSDLRALDRLASAWAAGSLGADPRTVAPAFGLSGYRAGISWTAATRYTADYTRRYEGREIVLGPHLARGVGPANQIMRIYWWVDREAGRFVIGHVGAHLRDASYVG